MKRLISILIAMTLLVSCFAIAPVMAADETITLEIDGAAYSPNTLPGTTINTVSTATLSAGQNIAYFLNGVEVGTASAAGKFNFTSVAGENNLQAKIMNGAAVVAESNVVALDFVDFYKGDVIKSSPLSTLENSKVFTSTTMFDTNWATIAPDPDEDINGNALHFAEPTPAATTVNVPLSASSSGIERVDFDFYGVHYIGGLYMAHVTANCGCNHAMIGRADWPSGRALSVTRNYVYPKGKWVHMTMVIDNNKNIYDVYADGIQFISAQPFCVKNHNVADPQITSIQLPRPGWVGTITVGTDSAGNGIKEQHHGEFYLKNLEYYKYNAAEISATIPTSAVAGGKFVVKASEKFVDGMKYVYNVNGIDSEPTDDAQYICTAKTGINTVVVKAVKDGEVLATSDTLTVNAYRASNETVKVLTQEDYKVHGTNQDCYSLVDLSEQYPEYGQVQKLEMKSTSGQFYPQNGYLPGTTASGREYFANAAPASSDCITISYDLNPVKVEGSITNTLDYYWKAMGDIKAGEMYPVVMTINNGNITFGKDTNVASTSFTPGEWINIKYVFIKESQRVYFMVNDTVVHTMLFSEFSGYLTPFGGNTMFIIFKSNASQSGQTNTIYVDNFSLCHGVNPTISVSTNTGNTTVVSGYKVKVTVDHNVTNGKVNFYHNDRLIKGNSSDKDVFVPAESGENTVYAELLDEYGAVIAASGEVTFNGYADTFEMALHRDGSTSTFAKHNKHVSTSNEYKDYGVIGYEDDTTTFASDANHLSTLKLSSGLAGTAGNSINVLTYYNGRKPNAAPMANASRLYTQSLDVYPENITNGGLSFRVYYPSTNSRESLISNAFVFGTDSISVATARGGSTSVSVPYTQGKWYNVKAIFDPMAGKIMLAVNDVIYSVIDESATEYAPLALNNELASNYLYFDITLNGSGVEEPNVVYLDNNDFEYSVIPAYTPVQYTNGGSVVTNRSQISSENDLTIKFTANKGEFNNVLCIATVLENNGELACLDTQDVTFTEGVDSANVELTLTNLPDSIATGGYTVNVMLWDKVTQTPIVTKVVLPN